MRIGSLFSGAGGLDMAVQAVFGGEVVWHCENDPAASKVLAAHWPGVPNLGDITNVAWGFFADPVDILCGGFPCQDVSAAGKRAGITADNRSGLWAYYADAIEALQPRLVIIENVKGLLSAKAHRNMESRDDALGNGSDRPILRAIGAVLGDLSDLGYDTVWATVSAADVGSCHRRDRVFIVAHASRNRLIRGAERHLGPTAGIATPQRQDADRRSVGTGVELLPTPTTLDHVEKRTGGNPTLQGALCGFNPKDVARLLPTPQAHDAHGAKTPEQIKKVGHSPSNLNETVRNYLAASKVDDDNQLELLATPQARDRRGAPKDGFNQSCLCRDVLELAEHGWGEYEPAVRRWESLTRPVPPPAEPSTNGKPRVRAEFSEWMMGWPEGWVTDLPLSRTEKLVAIGNGVVPQQAEAALRYLLSVSEAA